MTRRKAYTIAGIIGFVALVAAGMFGGVIFSERHAVSWTVRADGNPVGGTFTLVTLGDSTVDEATFRGSWLAVWFYDPRCPKARCQPVLAAIEAAGENLKARGIPFQAIAVSLDPAATTDEQKDYVLPVAPHVMPLLGALDIIRAMTTLYRAPFRDVGGYVGAAPSIVVMDPSGRYETSVEAGDDAGPLSDAIGEAVALREKK